MRFFSLLLLLGLVILAGCGDGRTLVVGKVIDPAGKPIEDAKITLTTGDEITQSKSSKTNTEGKFEIGMTHAPFGVDLALSVEKIGYKTHTETIKSRSGQFTREITLEPTRK